MIGGGSQELGAHFPGLHLGSHGNRWVTTRPVTGVVTTETSICGARYPSVFGEVKWFTPQLPWSCQKSAKFRQRSPIVAVFDPWTKQYEDR
jgi:hypothetical protein